MAHAKLCMYSEADVYISTGIYILTVSVTAVATVPNRANRMIERSIGVVYK